MVLPAHTLDVDVCMAAMKLLAMFPRELKKIWVTVEEMHEWLILCGVETLLCPEMLVNVIRRANRNGLLSTRRYWHTTYYRSCEFNHMSMVPIDQHRLSFHRHHLEPIKSNPQAAELLSYINAGLLKYADNIATRNFTEEQHKVLEELLCDIRKNPTISEQPRAQYLVDFFLEIKSNPILYKSFHRQDVTVTPTPFDTALAEFTTDHTTNNDNANNNNNTMVPITLLGDAPPNNTSREDGGDHTRCKNPMFCTYLQCKDEHPLMTPAELDDKYASNSKRNEGKYMDLTPYGIITLENIISKRFNLKNIDSIANCASSNACEEFFG